MGNVSGRRWSIGQLARASGVTVRTLHYYDEIGLVLTAQLADLERQTSRIEGSKQRVRAMLDQLAGSVMPEPEQFLSTLEPLRVDLDRHLTKAQQTAMTESATSLGTAKVEALKAEWIDLFTQLRQHLHDGTPAEDEQVKALAHRWQELAATFGTDERLRPALQAIWQDNRIGEQLDQRLGWQGAAGTTEILAYLEKAKS